MKQARKRQRYCSSDADGCATGGAGWGYRWSPLCLSDSRLRNRQHPVCWPCCEPEGITLSRTAASSLAKRTEVSNVWRTRKAGYTRNIDTQPLVTSWLSIVLTSAFPYPEHLSPTYGAHTLSRRLSVSHDYGPGVFHFSLGTTLDTVGLHLFTSFCVLVVA